MKKHILKNLAVSASVMALALGTVGGTALAAESGTGATDPAPTGSTSYQAVYLTKTLVSSAPSLDENYPAELAFTFKVEEQGFYRYSGSSISKTADDTVPVPGIADQTLVFSKADMEAGTHGGISEVTKESVNLIKGIQFTTPGVYVYDVSEQADTYSTQTGEKLTYDEQDYAIRVYVKNDGKGGTTTEATVEETENENGPTDINKATGAKVDPGNETTPTDPTDPGTKPDPTDPQGTIVTKANGFNFKNIFTVQSNNTTGPVDPGNPINAAFWVGKSVAGDLADTAKNFEFKLTLAKSDLLEAATYTLKREGQPDVLVTPGAEATFTLHHGQKAYFEDLPVGTNITVSETPAADYQAASTLIWNGVKGAGTADVTGITGTGANSAAYLNTNSNTITPTGILMNNLPYLALILAGIVGFTYYIISKRRRDA